MIETIDDGAASESHTLIGALALVDPLNTALATALIGRAPLPLDAEQLLAAMVSAGWLTSRSTAPSNTEWRWVPGRRSRLRSAFRLHYPEQARRGNEVASDWFSSNGLPARALRYATIAQSWPRVIALVESQWRHLVFERPATLSRALAATPIDALAASSIAQALRELLGVRPTARMRLPAVLGKTERDAVGRSSRAGHGLEVSLAALVVLRRRREYALARAYGEQCTAIMAADQARRPSQTLGLASLVYVETAILWEMLGDPAALTSLREAYRCAPAAEFAFSGADATARLALSHAFLGQLPQSADWLVHFQQCARVRGLLAGTISGMALLAEAMIAAGQLDRARMEMALDALGTSLDHDEYRPFVLAARSSYALIWGDEAYKLACLETVRREAAELVEWRVAPTLRDGLVIFSESTPSKDTGVVAALIAAVQANLLFALGRGNEASALLRGRNERQPFLDGPRARLALLSNDNQHARDLALMAIDRPMMLSAAQRLDLTLTIAVASHRLGRSQEATDALRRAVHQANLMATLAPFARLPREDLLAIAASVPEALVLLANERVVRAARVGPALQLVTLSNRERTILYKLSQGSSAAQIAAALRVSVNTIRTQRRSLYRKLSVTSRDEALVVADQLRLLGWPDEN